MTEFYTQNGWKGENYKMGTDTKDIAANIRAKVKEKFPDCKFSITIERYSGGSAINIYLMEAPFKAIKHDMVREFKDGEEVWIEKENKGYAQLNPYAFLDPNHNNLARNGKNNSNGTILTQKAWDCMKFVSEFTSSYRMDDSDGMIDYFNTNFYCHLNIGKWDKPFKIVEKTATSKPAKNSKTTNVVEFGEYKGHPTIKLPCNGKGFTFGLAMAKTILNHIEEIKKFVSANK